MMVRRFSARERACFFAFDPFWLALGCAFGLNARMSFGSERTGSSRSTRWTVVALSSLPVLLACENTDPKPKVSGGIVITNGANYKATLAPNIPRTKTADKADLNICWNGITGDFLCRSVDASKDINSVNFLQITGLTADNVVQYLKEEKDFSTKVSLSRSFQVGAASGSMCAKLSSFPSAKPDQDYYAASNKTYMLLFATGTKLGVGAKSMMFIEPSAEESRTDVAAPDGCGIVTFDTDITTITPVPASKDGPFVVDWSQVTVDGLGNHFEFFDIDLLQLGFYQGETPASLQQHFVDLDRIATTFYELDLYQATPSTKDGAAHADLTQAASKNAGPFVGFDRTDGVWVLALRCTECQLPAPTIVAVLTPI
jgi:hypothetical protein